MELRIAFVTYELVHGGSLTFLINISREFQRRKVAHCIISLHPRHPLERDFTAAGVNTLRPKTPPRSYEDGIAFGLEQLRAFNPTHIIGCLGPQSLEILRYVPQGVCRLGIVQTDDQPVYNMLANYAPFLDATIGVSEYSCDVLSRYPQLVSKPIYYQPYGIPFPEQLRRSLPVQGQPIRITYVGRLVREQKRVHVIPQIWQKLSDSDRPFVWRIAGEGPQLASLQKNLRTNSGQQLVRFEGQIPYSRIPELMLNSDIFLLPSDYEGLPLSLLEAMAQGAVPVVSDLPSGIREVVNSDTGKLVNPENIDGYAAAILELDSDRQTLAKMSLAASSLVRNGFSTEAMASRWLRMLSELPSAAAVWPISQKVSYSIMMRRLGLPFLPAVRPVAKLIDRVAVAVRTPKTIFSCGGNKQQTNHRSEK
jgi:glycosyltransferase involved in cell wall biosynthesis